MLASAFLILGAQAFGGQAVTVALPGSTNVGMAAYLGQQLHGLTGALTTTVFFLLPSFLVMLIFAVFFHSLVSLHGVLEALRGLTVAVVGLVGTAALKLGKKTVRGWYGWLIALLTFVLSVRFHVNPALLVILAGLWGVGSSGGGECERGHPLEPVLAFPGHQPRRFRAGQWGPTTDRANQRDADGLGFGVDLRGRHGLRLPRPCPPVVGSNKQCTEARQKPLPSQECIQPLQRSRQGTGTVRSITQHVSHGRHLRRCHKLLAREVADDDSRAALVHGEHVVEIAPHACFREYGLVLLRQCRPWDAFGDGERQRGLELLGDVALPLGPRTPALDAPFGVQEDHGIVLCALHQQAVAFLGRRHRVAHEFRGAFFGDSLQRRTTDAWGTLAVHRKTARAASPHAAKRCRRKL